MRANDAIACSLEAQFTERRKQVANYQTMITAKRWRLALKQRENLEALKSSDGSTTRFAKHNDRSVSI